MMRSSSPSSPPADRNLGWQAWLILALAVFASLGGYLVYSAVAYRIGFPLDDSWIHQTYARNLALRGEWSFIPGQVSGGSTSPLWSALLAVGYWLNISPYIWTYSLGGILLFVLAVCAEAGVRSLVQDHHGILPWAGLLVVFEWHLVWATASGMETLLHALLVFLVLILLMSRSDRWVVLGALAGLSVWVRPDGLTLLGPIIFVACFASPRWTSRLRALSEIILGFGVFFLPYLLFNLLLTGTAMPTTFYAKQAEYAAWQARPILERVGEGCLQLFTGAGIVLLPGVILSAVRFVRRKEWGGIAALLWIVGYLAMYLLRLPAYQHGRYLMPTMPILYVLGLVGYFCFIHENKKTSGRWFLRTSWGATLLLVCSAFWFLGMKSYGDDVSLIESEMVDSARWVAANVPEDSLVAAHDIGALGYFGEHNIVDLAGLISPEVIPFLRDETALADYLNRSEVHYLVAFPDWYHLLTADLEPVYVTGGTYAPSVGETNMTVYRWPGP